MKYEIIGPPEELNFSITTQYKLKDNKGQILEIKHTKSNISDEFLRWDENKSKWIDLEYDHPFLDFIDENPNFLN